MGYLDAATSRYFKTGKNGRKLFFPWGVLGRGYLLGSEGDYEQLRRRLKTYTTVALVAVIGSVASQVPIVAIVTAGLLVAFYVVWMSYLLRSLQPSDERLSWRESMEAQALAHSAVTLWSLEIVSLCFAGAAAFILVVAPAQWLRALATMIFFGACAAALAFMLVLRSRHAAG